MRTSVCDLFGIELPIFAFTRSREVVREVSKAGGMGVLGAIAFAPEELESELAWLDEHMDGKPYGVDVVMPMTTLASGDIGSDVGKLEEMIPAGHKQYVEEVLAKFHVPQMPETATNQLTQGGGDALLNWTYDRARKQVDIALAHPVRLIANALGPPPEDVVRAAHDKNVLVVALVGNVHQAKAQDAADVDIIVAQGTEAGGHTGDVAGMVLIPEVVDAVAPKPVLAAGGIGRGRQIAAALALGAEGVWTGSVWLTTEETEFPPVIVEKLLAATSRDTVRSRSLTGKPARQLRTAWTEAWDGPESPGTLPMPLQFMLTANAISRINTYAEDPSSGAHELAGSPVGQIVGSMNRVRPVRDVIDDMVREYRDAVSHLDSVLAAD
jgi:NAD(P)H-dependent flavin oxidoreductase YrpB (nitropropane dioxygenase family)